MLQTKAPPAPDIALAESLLARMKQAHWSDAPDTLGMHAYGYTKSEQQAIDIVVDEAVNRQGMEALSDLAGNIYLIKHGKNGGRKTDIFVSHLDTVEKGGAHDGRDGIAAGLAVVAGLNKAGQLPENDLCVMIARSEESCINGQVSIGALTATGQLKSEDLAKLKNRKTGHSVLEHMKELGIPAATLMGRLDASPTLFPTQGDAQSLIGFLAEAHIEQGNYCAKQNVNLAVVDAIRGNTRFLKAAVTDASSPAPQGGPGTLLFSNAAVTGEAAHSGATFEEDRADAVRTFTALMHKAEEWVKRKQAMGYQLEAIPASVASANTSPTTVASDVAFTFGIRSNKEHLLAEFADEMKHAARLLEKENAKLRQKPGANQPESKLKITLPQPILTPPIPGVHADLGAHHADAVAAYTTLMHKAEEWYQHKRARGYDLVYTPAVLQSGQDGANVTFSFEIRSKKEHLLKEFAAFMQQTAHEIESQSPGGKLKITLPAPKFTDPAAMDGSVIEHVREVANRLSLNTGIVTSGAGHDTAQFANTGAPSIMIFIKQDDPISHNPRESRNAASFADACRLMMGMVATPRRAHETAPAPSGAKTFTDYVKQQGALSYAPGQWRK